MQWSENNFARSRREGGERVGCERCEGSDAGSGEARKAAAKSVGARAQAVGKRGEAQLLEAKIGGRLGGVRSVEILEENSPGRILQIPRH